MAQIVFEKDTRSKINKGPVRKTFIKTKMPNIQNK